MPRAPLASERTCHGSGHTTSCNVAGTCPAVFSLSWSHPTPLERHSEQTCWRGSSSAWEHKDGDAPFSCPTARVVLYEVVHVPGAQSRAMVSCVTLASLGMREGPCVCLLSSSPLSQCQTLPKEVLQSCSLPELKYFFSS